MVKRAERRVLALALLALCLAGCAGMHAERRYTSSVVQYLYPKDAKAEVPAVPRLALPLQVGVAFVPEEGSVGAHRLSEKEKMDLMERISAEFRKYPFVKGIELIPSSYLTRGGGFANLDQIRTMYGTDVIALLSHDQVQHTDQGLLSLSYWTIVGAYVIRGEKNDTNTMVDAAVYHVPSRKLLFRAPGTSHVKGRATPVNLTEQLRADSRAGFELASDELVANLQDQLERFKVKVREAPQEYVVEHRPGYTGGGSLGGVFSAALLVLGGLALRAGRRT
ncbi:MAG: rhombotarget lipoprotein [Deltaproteobacteria bacterium]|nr:rhombotarget lipoprotein [Deltaproteobacteria bacterium]